MSQTVEEMIAALEAFKRDGKIQYTPKERATDRWIETNIPIWNFYRNEYRPVPKPVEVWAWKTNKDSIHRIFPTKNDAECYGTRLGAEGRAVLMREVIE